MDRRQGGGSTTTFVCRRRRRGVHVDPQGHIWYLVIRGPNSCFPLAAACKKQACQSLSTPEAEIIAAAYALKVLGLPAHTLWCGRLLKNCKNIVFHDNQAMIRIMTSGKNPTMRYMARTHGLSIGWMHHRFRAKDFVLIYELSERMAADIFTKGFTEKDTWEHGCK